MSKPFTEDARRLHNAHKRMKTRRGKASAHLCVDCGEQAKDWSRIHEKSGDDPFDYEPRCRSCHLKYDYTDERREKISRANKGQEYNNSFSGRKHSEETRAKMSVSNKAAWAIRKQKTD